jgi:secondary thiamine-phosphate synthase enzyme
METFDIRTSARTDLRNITSEVAAAVRTSGTMDGPCVVFVAHTTAGVTINENADPAVSDDIGTTLDRMIPWNGPYKHNEGNSAAHLKATLVGSSVTVPVHRGKLVLGTWQGIFLCEFDGPRTRQVHVQPIFAN